jgi:hypothetical protein
MSHPRVLLALHMVVLHLDGPISGMLIANGNGFHAHMQEVKRRGLGSIAEYYV